MKINHHPAKALLAAHVTGQLPTATSAALAVHIDNCPQCQRICQAVEAQASQAQFSDSMAVDEGLLDTLLAQLNDEVPPVAIREAAPITVSVNGDTFVLPKALAGLSGQIGNWRRLGSKVWTADVDLGEKDVKASFLYADKQTRIPRHTHGGEEITLVLAGKLNDERGQYGQGDFMLMTPDDEHQPFTQEQSCLCFTVLSAPLVLTGPLGRMANPLLRLFF
ncbi:ChrR family anti-sigma-E factor [Gallaecimonas mangrovi]|uniref:ChrR family anti-sigma-E factor n=1 Tax=Gallaecimonas mangrovi TaxID=2291597 RepID=UPI000E205BCD|nr:ChrR family anti-sigma-E factor [Gallaecimonas mangrovi]